ALPEVIPPPLARGTFARAHAGDVRPAEPFRLFPADACPEVQRRKFQLKYQTRSCFVLSADREISVPVRPVAGQALVFAVAVDRPRPGGEFALSLAAEASDTEPRVLFEWQFPSASADAAVWQPVRVELDRYAGRQITLRFTARVDAPEAALLLAEPRLEGPPSAERPNVVLYMIETLRRDHLSVYGYHHRTTPFLERLGREAVVFTGSHSQSSWTKPSVASYLTGLHPGQHGALTGLDRLGGPFLTLAEMLREEGYSAGGFCASPVVSNPSFNYDQGFDVFTDERMVRGEHLIADAVEWLDRERPSPFFMWLFTYDPHAPYRAPKRYREHFAGPYHGPLKEVERFARPAFRQALGGGIAPQDVDYVKARYDGEILYSDAVLSDFVSALKRRGLWNNTILIVCGDHGEEFYEHGDWDHARDLFPEKLRVPLLIKLPRQRRAGSRVGGLASSVDLVPTLLPQLGLEPDLALPGRDLLASGGDDTGRELHFAEYWEPHYTERDGRMITHIVAVHHSVIGPRYQYVWQQHRLPADLTEVARGRDCLWILSRGGEIWLYQPASPERSDERRREHVAGRLQQISAGPDGGVWGINEAGALFARLGVSSRSPTGSSWQQLPGEYRSVTAGPAGVWAVDAAGRLLRRTGITDDEPTGDRWEPCGEGCAQVSAGAGRVWVVGEDGSVRCGPTTAGPAPEADAWTDLEGALQRVDAGPTGVVWALDRGGQALVRTGITPEQPAGTGWDSLPDRLVSVAVGAEHVWAVGEDGQLLVRVGVSTSTPQGTSWQTMDRSTAPQESLYDLVVDPAAQRDVADEYPDVLARMAELVRERYQRTGLTIAVNGTGRRRTVRGTVEAEGVISEVEHQRVEPEDVVALATDRRSLSFELQVTSDDDVLHLRTDPPATRLTVRLQGAEGESVFVGPQRAAHAGGTVEIGPEPGPADAAFGHAVKYATGSEGGVFIWRRLPAGERQSRPITPEEETMQQLRDLGYL
ncbi:MAG: tectonin domain-containing protein, partial [Candidatus Brocadiia bacterium]